MDKSKYVEIMEVWVVSCAHQFFFVDPITGVKRVER